MLNAAFAKLELPIRCLPLQVGNAKRSRRIIEAVRLLGVVVEEDQQDVLRDVAAEIDADAVGVTLNEGGLAVEHAIDLLVQPEQKKWQGAHTFSPGAVAVRESTLKENGKSLDGLIVMIAGLTPQSRSIARAIKERGGKLVFAAQVATKRRGVAACSAVGTCNSKRFTRRCTTWSSSAAKPATMAAMKSEICCRANSSPWHDRHGPDRFADRNGIRGEAKLRGCKIVSPRRSLVEQVRGQVKRSTGQDVPARRWKRPFPVLLTKIRRCEWRVKMRRNHKEPTMIIGVPKEIKTDEYRVAMIPVGVEELTIHSTRS